MQTRTKSSNLIVGLASAGIIGPPLFLLISTVTAINWPEYNIVRQSVSDLVRGPYSWLQTLNFFLFGLSLLAFTTGLHFSINGNRMFRIGLGFIFFVGFAYFLMALFPSDIPGTPHTVAGIIHLIGAIGTGALFPFACFLIVPSIRRDPHWKGLATYTVATGAVMLILEVGREFLLPDQWVEPWFGLYERTLTLVSLAWVEVMAVRLLLIAINRKKSGGS